MEDSILTSIKKVLGPSEENTAFDLDIIMFINSVFFTLAQIGVGPSTGFSISDKTSVWDDFISDDHIIDCVKIYIYARVRLKFDPPASAAHIKVLEEEIKECESRLNYYADNGGDS